MQTAEKYCATRLRVIEAEQFFAVGDTRLTQFLNKNYREDLERGQMQSLPDLLSVKTERGETFFRIREVKFKLEERLVRKALRQLRLKPAEHKFLGAELGANRYELLIDGEPQRVGCEGEAVAVTVLLVCSTSPQTQFVI